MVIHMQCNQVGREKTKEKRERKSKKKAYL
jgi:hypothetical protein